MFEARLGGPLLPEKRYRTYVRNGSPSADKAGIWARVDYITRSAGRLVLNVTYEDDSTFGELILGDSKASYDFKEEEAQ